MTWYYLDGLHQQVGPIDEETFQTLVKEGRITPQTFVWKESLPQWQPYEEVAPNAIVPKRPEPPPLQAQAESAAPTKPKREGFLGWLGVAGVVTLKFGALALKSLKTVLSMGFMICTYSWLFGWRFAAGFVLLIFVHEMGHVIAARWLGMPVTAPIFIPFVGAYITMKQHRATPGPKRCWPMAARWQAASAPGSAMPPPSGCNCPG